MTISFLFQFLKFCLYFIDNKIHYTLQIAVEIRGGDYTCNVKTRAAVF